MLRRAPVFQATSGEEISSGLQPDMQELRQILWAEAENVRFYNGKVVRNLPAQALFTAGDEPIRGLSQQRDLNGVRWVWSASGDEIRRWYGPAPELIDTLPLWYKDSDSIHDATIVDFIHWGNWTVFNSSLGKLRIHKPGVSLGDIADGPSDIVKIAKKLSFLMAIGYGARGTRVGFSDADNIETWTPTADNLAGSISIDDFDTRIKTAYRLGQHIGVYGEDQLALVSYISAPYYFGQKTVLDGIGAVGKAAVTGDGGSNFGVGRNGIWWTDSNSYRYIDGALHDYLQEEVNWEQAAKIVAARNDVTNCYDFYFPMRESDVINEGWSFDPTGQGWSPIPAVSMQDERKLFNKPIVGNSAGVVSEIMQDATVNAPLALCTRPLLMQAQGVGGPVDPHTDVHVDELELLIKNAVGVEFRVESAEKVEGPYEETPWTTVQPNSATYLLDRLPSGVYWKLRFRSIISNWQFNLQGFLFYGQVEGSKRGVS